MRPFSCSKNCPVSANRLCDHHESMSPYPSILYNILVVFVCRPYEVVVRDLGLSRKVLGGVSLERSWAWSRNAYSEYICTLVTETLGISTSFGSSFLNLHTRYQPGSKYPARFATFSPCSSVPVHKIAFFPLRMLHLLIMSVRTMVYKWPT